MEIILDQTPGFGSPVTRNSTITLVANNLAKGKTMNPEKLNQVVMLSYFLPPGFLKSHIRVETDIFGPIIDLYNEYIAPGEEITLLIPSGKKADILFFIDDRLETILTVDPWEQDTKTGELTWELLPLQFYPPISQNLQMN